MPWRPSNLHRCPTATWPPMMARQTTANAPPDHLRDGPPTTAETPPNHCRWPLDLHHHCYFVRGIVEKIYNVSRNFIVNQTQEYSFSNIFCRIPKILIYQPNTSKTLCLGKLFSEITFSRIIFLGMKNQPIHQMPPMVWIFIFVCYLALSTHNLLYCYISFLSISFLKVSDNYIYKKKCKIIPKRE